MASRRFNFTNLVVIAMVIFFVVVLVFVVGLALPQPEEVLQGEAETTEYRVSSMVPGRIQEFRVQTGDHVRKGDTLAILSAPIVEAKLSQAEAAESAAMAIEQKARNGARQEQIQGAYEMWQKAKAGVEVAEKTFARVQRLHDEGVIAQQKYDEAYAQLTAMQATERAAKSQYDMAVNGARAEDKAAAQAQVARARGAISEVEGYINETALTAYEDGVVTEIFPKLGELVGTGAPVMNVALTDQVKFVFTIREDKLPELKTGTEYTVYVPAVDRQLQVRISNMKVMGSYSTWKATKALDNYDLKTFEVVALPVNTADIHDILAGMTAIIKEEE